MKQKLRGTNQAQTVTITRPPWQRVLITTALALPVIISGCTNSYIDHPKVSVADGSNFGSLATTITKYEDLRVNQVQNTRNDEARYRKMLTAVTFGAIAGGGAAALYGAHPDVIFGFGLAGGGAYGGSTLFYSPERGKTLNSGNSALQCMAQTSAEIISADLSFASSEARMTDISNKIQDCTSEEAVKAKQAAGKAKTNLKAFRNLDAAFTSQHEDAAGFVIKAMNEQLEALEPTPESALRAGQAVSQFATGFLSRATTEAAAKDSLIPKIMNNLTEKSTLTVCENEAVNAQELLSLSQALEATMAAKTNKMAAMKTACVFSAEALKTMAAAPAELNIAKDVSVPVNVTGAFGLLNARWVGTAPASDVLIFTIDSANRISIKGNSKLTKDTPKAELEIYDQRPVPTPVKITIQPTG